MLKALYDYGIRRGLALPPGFVRKTVKAYISLTDTGGVAGIYQSEGDPVPCPDIGSSAQSKDKSNILVEKRSVVLPEKPTEKSAFFLEALRCAAEAEPDLEICVHALENPETAAMIRAELDRAKIKGEDRISFRVNGRSVLESENVRAWWQEYRKQFSADTQRSAALCLITGEPAVPVATTPPVQGLRVVGGHSRGDALICFDKAAFCSYDQKQAANAPVSEEAFCVVKAALDDLLQDAPVLLWKKAPPEKQPRKSPVIAGMKFVHWYDRELPPEDDPMLELDAGGEPSEEDAAEEEEEAPVDEIEARQQADRVPESVASGANDYDLDGVSYYILLLSGVNGRAMIRKYDRGSYAELRRCMDQWYDDLALVNRGGIQNIGRIKLSARLLYLLKYQKNDKNPFERAGKELAGITPAVIQAILSGAALPDTVAARALAYIRSELMRDDGDDTQKTKSSLPNLPNRYACQWLKVWLLRKNRMQHQEEPILENYNPNISIAAYHCGALMAVYAAIQKKAMPNVNTSVVERYYASAIQMPALVIGQLSSRSNHHLEMIENEGVAENFRGWLRQVSVALGTSIPATLNLEQQSYFALGYYQMGAELNRERNEKIAASREKREAAEE